MKRWLVRICVFLLLGAIVNVAVAWGHAYFLPVNTSLARSEVLYFSGGPHWEVDVIHRRGGVMVISRAFDGESRTPGASDAAPSWSISSSPPAPADCAAQRQVTEHAYGWPMLCLFSRTNSFREPLLPLMPIPAGMILNSVVFALVVGTVYATVNQMELRARRRIKRGLCPKCAYPVGTNAVCTECGQALK